MEEFISRISPYLSCLLSSEGVPDATMCQSCVSSHLSGGALIASLPCALFQVLPRLSPVASFPQSSEVDREIFYASCLQEVGISLKLGHSGDLCTI
jgi:hypothetical protein